MEDDNLIEDLDPSLQYEENTGNNDDDIVTSILLKLDGWILDTTNNNELLPTKYNKKVNRDEVLHFYNMAGDYAKSYTDREDLTEIPICSTALSFWSAGLLWEKYNVRSNNQIDETNTLGYGDKLIIQAKEMLKPYKRYSFNAY